MDKISVVIATYNRFKYLLNTIKSINNQTYKNIEIIVVNDKSTDPTYYKYDWSRTNVKMIHLPQNTKKMFGHACAGFVRNRGIKESSGKYIAFCDDDDIWFPKKIELQLEAIKKTGCKMSSTNGWVGNGVFNPNKKYPPYLGHYNHPKKSTQEKDTKITSEQKDVLIYPNGFPNIWNLEFLKPVNYVICSSVLIEKSILDKINNMKHVKNGVEDYDCWLRALQHTNSVFVNDMCFYYDRNHGDGKNY